MKFKTAIGVALVMLCSLMCARAQEATTDTRSSEPRVPLNGEAVAYDIEGRTALVARLRTTTLAGIPDAPERNTRIVIDNRGTVFYTYASGWATFYGGDNVRCGEGAWKVEALAPGESAEVDTPGLRLTCTPATWRIVAANLLTRTTDFAKPANESGAPPAETPPMTGTSTPPAPPATPSTDSHASLPPLEIVINGRVVPIQLGNPLEFVFGKERVRLVLQTVK